MHQTTKSTAAALIGFALLALGMLLPDVAFAARKAVCEDPAHGVCVATKDTGLIKCACNDGRQLEVENPDITDDNEDELLDACWIAYSQTCAPWAPEWTACEEPDLGSCEVTGDKGGQARCDCDDGTSLEEEDLFQLEDLSADAMEDACYEQLDRVCGAPPPAPAMQPPPAAPSEGFGDSGGGSSLGCAVDRPGTGGAAGWLAMLGLLGLPGAIRRRRRG